MRTTTDNKDLEPGQIWELVREEYTDHGLKYFLRPPYRIGDKLLIIGDATGDVNNEVYCLCLFWGKRDIIYRRWLKIMGRLIG